METLYHSAGGGTRLEVALDHDEKHPKTVAITVGFDNEEIAFILQLEAATALMKAMQRAVKTLKQGEVTK